MIDCMRKKVLLSLSVLLVLCILAVVAYLANSAVRYKNEFYGFSISLPRNWKGFSVLENYWLGYRIDEATDMPTDKGPVIIIRNPNWTGEKPYQDIPIMVFTIEQWKMIEGETLSVSAAPFPPTELGRNNLYVFALPARYNYAFYEGWREVDEILKSNPFVFFNP